MVTSWFEATETENATKENRDQVLKHYDNTKRASDFFNQTIASYHDPHTLEKWERLLLLGWFEVVRTNAYILFNLVYPDRPTHKEFVLEVAASFLLGWNKQ